MSNLCDGGVKNPATRVSNFCGRGVKCYAARVSKSSDISVVIIKDYMNNNYSTFHDIPLFALSFFKINYSSNRY